MYNLTMELTERTRMDWIRWQLCRAIAARLRKEPDVVMKILLDNMERAGTAGIWGENEDEWMDILESHTPQHIAELLEAETHESQRLRSNFRGFHVLSEIERHQIIDAGYGIQSLPETLIHAA
jgi:hypothetical protein